MKSAEEWIRACGGGTFFARLTHREIEAIQRDALEAAAKACETMREDVRGPTSWLANRDCAEAIRALKPKERS